MELEEEIIQLEKEKEKVSREFQNAQQRILKLNKMIKEKKSLSFKRDHGKAFEVSDHAVARYIERVQGNDLTHIRKKIYDEVNEKVPELEMCVHVPDGEYDCRSFVAVIKNNKLLSVLKLPNRE